jgi:hypothetical protein
LSLWSEHQTTDAVASFLRRWIGSCFRFKITYWEEVASFEGDFTKQDIVSCCIFSFWYFYLVHQIFWCFWLLILLELVPLCNLCGLMHFC